MSKSEDTITQTGLSPIIKWAGGKERELAHIFKYAPQNFKRFYEPFVGGGSVYMAMPCDEHFINDKSEELISLYRSIQAQDSVVFSEITKINNAWKNTLSYVSQFNELKEIYGRYRDDITTKDELRKILEKFIECKLHDLTLLLEDDFARIEVYEKELKRNVVEKFVRMCKLEKARRRMPDADVSDNIKTAFMGSLYMYYRNLYNSSDIQDDAMKTALFVFIRNYAYSGMFRYNSNGEFNVPYGGIGYNDKTLDKKIAYYRSDMVRNHFVKTKIESMDFEEFFVKHPPQRGDFVFLDPPYDSDFSTYAKNAFSRDDQKRLADYLINRCDGYWMMIIKFTPFIYSLYDGHDLTIKSFDKTYQVSFMNRNNRDVQHLIITNYKC